MRKLFSLLKYTQIYIQTTIHAHAFSIAIYRINANYYLVFTYKATLLLNYFHGKKIPYSNIKVTVITVRFKYLVLEY